MLSRGLYKSFYPKKWISWISSVGYWTVANVPTDLLRSKVVTTLTEKIVIAYSDTACGILNGQQKQPTNHPKNVIIGYLNNRSNKNINSILNF